MANESLFHSRFCDVWHVVCDTDLRDLLRRANEGEDPELLYIEFYANGSRDDDC